MSKMADSFIGLYPLSKTLRFELRPIGRTLEYIERDGIIKTDTDRAEDYKKVKKLIDEYHKAFIETVLEKFSVNGLDEYFRLYNDPDRNTTDFERIQTDMRKQISKAFKSNQIYKTIDKKELIKNDLVDFFKDDPEKLNLIRGFSDFTTYFTGFHQNRQNMYSDEEKSTSIAYRLIHQNLPKYDDNIKVYNSVLPAIFEDLGVLQNSLRNVFPDMPSIDDYFSVPGYNLVLSQKGIDLYNTILGGYSSESGEKIQGLNEYINLYSQKTGERLPKLKPLFKMILSDRDSTSFIPEQFDADAELLNAIENAYKMINESIILPSDGITITELFDNMHGYDLERIYISNDNSITAIAQEISGNWSLFRDAVENEYDAAHPIGKSSPEKYEEKKKSELKKIRVFSVSQLQRYLAMADTSKSISEYFSKKINNCINEIQKQYEVFKGINYEKYESGKSLKSNDADISIIKSFLDSIKALQWAIKPLINGQKETIKDELFYVDLLRFWENLDLITPLYNKVRNYVTEKVYSEEKVKLNFGKSTLLNGWDKNKERDNLGIILIKDELYYLGIMNKADTRSIESAPAASTENTYRKMNYKLLPGPNKMLPKVFFSKSRIAEFNPSPEIVANYKAGTHTKGDNFNIDDCHALIDFFKSSINRHEDWSQFGFRFSATDSYNDISEFYREVSQQGYKLTFTDIDSSYIDTLVDDGRLYLFQIYSKDFSTYSKGMPNLHTLYWKELFSPENIRNTVYKLNGEAEIFFRKASIKHESVIVHPSSAPIRNKDPFNGKNESIFEYDIVKDRRYTCDKFQFHVPITMNFKAEGENRFNLKVNNKIAVSDDIHIIGIDRGERNLLYLSVIDMNGKIVEQMSLNEILTYGKDASVRKRDYHRLLSDREKENLQARQNWTTINTIKELKEGYLSQVVYVISRLMVEYNAILVLEDLNFGFKRGRQKFERQVYQKFEKMLIDKLNYYVDKRKKPAEEGGLLKAYQLTDKFESFQKLGKQSGFLFYVPAWNTSKIDPTTGFVNLFNTRYESVEKSRLFLGGFEKIWFDDNTGCFAFSFDYDSFTYKAEGTRTKWTIYSYGQRIDHFRNPEKNNEWDVKTVDLTESLNELFKEYDIDINNENFKKQLLSVDKADFYKRILKLISLILQMRNSNEAEGIDMMISPVLNSKRDFFVSGKDTGLPLDADANGAYNIAKKGLMLVNKIRETNTDDMKKIKLAISNKEWLKFAQEHTV